MSVCPRCNERERAEGQSYCDPCRAAYQKVLRERRPSLTARVERLEREVFKDE